MPTASACCRSMSIRLPLRPPPAHQRPTRAPRSGSFADTLLVGACPPDAATSCRDASASARRQGVQDAPRQCGLSGSALVRKADCPGTRLDRTLCASPHRHCARGTGAVVSRNADGRCFGVGLGDGFPRPMAFCCVAKTFPLHGRRGALYQRHRRPDERVAFSRRGGVGNDTRRGSVGGRSGQLPALLRLPAVCAGVARRG